MDTTLALLNLNVDDADALERDITRRTSSERIGSALDSPRGTILDNAFGSVCRMACDSEGVML